MTLTAESISFGSLQEDQQHPIYMMLSVPQQPQQQHHYHRSPPALHHIAPSTSPAHALPTHHRENVIVLTASNNNSSSNNNNNNNNNNNEPMKSTVSMQQAQVPQQRLPTQQVATAAQKKKMYSQSGTQFGSQLPASVARRNARERNRVKLVNDGYAKLRQHIPQQLAQELNISSGPPGNQSGSRAGNKKLSKVDTLRLALTYIKNLKQVIDEHDSEMSGASSIGSNDSVTASPMSSHHSPGPACVELEQQHHHHHHHQQHHPAQQQQQQQHQQQQLGQPIDIKFELKSECTDDEFQDIVGHHQQHQQHLQYHHPMQSQQSPIYVQTPNSEASSSPTPSFSSDASSTGGSQGYGSGAFSNAIYAGYTDGYDNCEPVSPEEEDQLLEQYLTMYPTWQQMQ